MTFRTEFRNCPPKILLHPRDGQGGGLYRIGQPANALRHAGYATTRVDNKTLSNETLHVMQPDSIVFQNPFTDSEISAIERYRKVVPDSYLVVDYDDLLWDIPANHPSRDKMPKDILKRIQKIGKLADKVVVSTDCLASYMHKDAKVPSHKIHILQNQLASSFINAVRAADRKKNDKLRVGWAGGLSHGPDLELIVDTVKQTKDEFQWVFMGSVITSDTSPLHEIMDFIEFHPAEDLVDYAYKLGSLNLDIGVVPLVNNRFNMSKSDLRVLELAAAGSCVVASAVEPYVMSSVSPIIVANTTEAWITELRKLASDRDLIFRNAERQYNHVRAYRSMENPDNLKKAVEAWLYPGANVFVPNEEIPSGLIPANIEKIDGGYVFVRKGTEIPFSMQEQFDNFAANHMVRGLGSISVLNNDCLYPINGRFVELREGAADIFNTAASNCAKDIIALSMPAGPYIVLTDSAVSRIGLPDTARYGMFEGALLDWAARAFESGFRQVMDMSSYASASTPFANTDLINFANQEAQAWYPKETFEGMEASVSKESDMLAKHMPEMDLKAFLYGMHPDEGCLRVLLLNGGNEFKEGLEQQGHKVLTGSLLGHLMTFDPALMPNNTGYDLRRDVKDVVIDLYSAGIFNIVLAGLGEGSSDILGSLARINASGVKVSYVPPYPEFIHPDPDVTNSDIEIGQAYIDANGSPFGYIDLIAWRNTWGRFLASINPEPETINE